MLLKTFIHGMCLLAFVAPGGQLPTTLPHVPGGKVSLPGEVEFKPAKMRIRYPGDFVDGRFAPVQPDDHRLFADALVLVEASRATAFDRTRLPVGDDALPAISVHALDAEFTKSVFTPLIKPEWRTSIGGREVIKFPGYPAPGGEKLHCYLVPRGDGTSLLFIGSRDRRRDGAIELTRYDWAMERIIADLQDMK